jgi:flagellar hook protein FlgE
MDLSVGLPSNADVASKRPMYGASNPWKFDKLDPNSYNESTQTTVYDSAGNAIPATVYFVRTQSTAAGDPTNSWDAYLFVGDQQASANPSSATPTPVTLQFDASGKLTTPTSATTFGSVSPTGASAPLNLSVDFGTATNQSTGTFTLASLEQDGHGTGKLNDISISDKGLVSATFSDGSTQALGKLAIANFSDPEGLKQLGDAHWAVTGNSGDAVVGTAGQDGFGSIQTGALERANVDITEELVSLIAAQRNFQANAKAIETDNTMTSTIVNLRS